MKKIYKIIVVVILVSLICGNIYAHGGNITGWKDKNSDKITLHNGKHYGYHNENGVRHYHEVEWNAETKRWEILKTAVYYDEKFNVIKKETGGNSEKIQVEFSSAVDGDTAKFKLDGKVITARFLGINTPETVAPEVGVQEWGPEASNYTKNALQNAKKIEIEYDEKAQKKDKYDRDLVWVWVDGKLLQEQIVLKGFAQEYMLQANYKYADVIQEAESIAKKEKVGMWETGNNTVTKEANTEKESEETIKPKAEESEEMQNEIVVIIGAILLGIISILVKKVNKKKKRKNK